MPTVLTQILESNRISRVYKMVALKLAGNILLTHSNLVTSYLHSIFLSLSKLSYLYSIFLSLSKLFFERTPSCNNHNLFMQIKINYFHCYAYFVVHLKASTHIHFVYALIFFVTQIMGQNIQN